LRKDAQERNNNKNRGGRKEKEKKEEGDNKIWSKNGSRGRTLTGGERPVRYMAGVLGQENNG